MSGGDQETTMGGDLEGVLELERLIQVALRHALLTENEVGQVMALINAHQTDLSGSSSPPLNPKVFCKAAMKAGLMTRFQAQVLLSRDPDALSIGPYLLVDKIGAGGMGSVYRARHMSMDRVVALKVLRRRDDLSPELLKRFKREILAAAKLTHPNIVTAFDAGEQRGVHYLVMEYISGGDLQTMLQKTGPLSVAKAVNYVRQAANGMQYAHEQKVVHRDIKPGNLLLSTDGCVKILDLGLAKILSDQVTETTTPSNLTVDGSLMGTVDYLSPEQSLDTKRADERSDIYSLGCTLYTLLAGQPVYPTGTLIQKVISHREGPIPRLSDLRSDVPEALERLLHEMLAKSPGERPPSMQAIAERLGAIASADLPATPPNDGILSGEFPDTQSFSASDTLKQSELSVLAPNEANFPLASNSSTKRNTIAARKHRHIGWSALGVSLIGTFAAVLFLVAWWSQEASKSSTSRLTLVFEQNDLLDIAGGEIWIDQQFRGYIQNDREEFDLAGPLNGHEIQVRHPGFDLFSETISTNTGVATELAVQLRRTATATIAAPATIGNPQSKTTPVKPDPSRSTDDAIPRRDSTEVASNNSPDPLPLQTGDATEEADFVAPNFGRGEGSEPPSNQSERESTQGRTLIVGIGASRIADLATAIEASKPNDTIVIEHQGPMELSPIDLTGKTPLTIVGGTQGGQDFWPIIRQRTFTEEQRNRLLGPGNNTDQPLFYGEQLTLHFEKIHLSVGGFGREKLTSIVRCDGGKISFDQCTITATTDDADRYSAGAELPLVQLTGAATNHLDLHFSSTLLRGGRLNSMVRIQSDASVAIKGQHLLWAGGPGPVIQVGFGTSQARLDLQDSTIYNFDSLVEIPSERLLQNQADRAFELQLDHSILMARDRGFSSFVAINNARNESFEIDRWRSLINLSVEQSVVANVDNWLHHRNDSKEFGLSEFLSSFQIDKGAIQTSPPRFRVLPAGVELQEVQARDLEILRDEIVAMRRETDSPPGARADHLPWALSRVAERLLPGDSVAGKPREPRQVIEVSSKNGPIRTLEEAFRLIHGEEAEIVITDSETYIPGRNFELDKQNAILYTEVPRYLTLRSAENESPLVVISDSARVQVGSPPKLSHWEPTLPQLFLFQIRALSWQIDGIRFATDITQNTPHGLFMTSARYVRMTNCSFVDPTPQPPAFLSHHNGFGIVTKFSDAIESERTLDGSSLSWIENVEVDHNTPFMEEPRNGLRTLPTIFTFNSNQGRSSHNIFRNCRVTANHTLVYVSSEAWVEIEGCSILGRLISTTSPLKPVRIHENLVFSLPQPVWTDPPGLVDSVGITGGGNALLLGVRPIPSALRNQGPFRWIPGPVLNRAPALDNKGRVKGRLQTGATMAEDGGPVGFRPERITR